MIKIGCNGIIVKNNKLLLGKRLNRFGEGTYGLPGGHLNFGEKIIDAVRRELKEEVNIEATNLEFCSLVDQADSKEHRLQMNFIIKEFSGEIKALEPDCTESWEWFELESLPHNIFPPHTDIIKNYMAEQLYSA